MVIQEGIRVELTVSSGIKLVTLPSVLNLAYTDAQVTLQGMGLNVEIALEASDTVTKNYVISMDPEAGASISSGSTVTLFVSAGPTVAYATVPNLVGMKKAEALMELQQRGLVCTEEEITYVSSEENEEGVVLWQNYDGGAEVISGTKVYLQIGSGPTGGEQR